MLSPTTATDTIQTLRDTPVHRPPNAGSDWQGIPHGELLDALVRGARSRGWTPSPVIASLSRNGADLAASFRLWKEREGVGEGRLALGLSVSNAARKQLRFYVGGWIDKDRAGYVTDAFLAGKRYTTWFNLADEVENALDRWELSADRQADRVRRLRDQPVTTERAICLLQAAGEADHFALSRMAEVMEKFMYPDGRVATFVPERNAWDLLVAFGKVTVAGRSPIEQLDHLLWFYRRLTVPAGEPVAA